MASTERSRLTIHDAGDGVVVLVGEIDAATAPKLHRCLEHDPRIRVLDMAQVTFMDSSGLGLIVESNQRARKHGFRFAIAVGGASDVHRILEMSGLTKVLVFADDPDAFLAGGDA